MRAAGLRNGDEGLAYLQPARCARRDLRHRARGVHRPRARPRARSGTGILRLSRAARLSDEALMQALLLEILTEELPPKSLRRSEEHTSELQSQSNLVCRLLLEKK